MNKRG
jgi:hypothetical protein